MHTTGDHRWRRAAGAVLAAAVAVLIVATPVAAEITWRVDSPTDVEPIRSPAAIRVITERELLDPAVRQVDVRVAAGQTAGDPVALRCIEGCDGEPTRRDFGGATLDPAAPAGFFSGAAPMCNGGWRLELRLNGGAWQNGSTFTVSYPPSAVGSLDLKAGRETVDVTWSAAPEPDVSGYKLDRRKVGASFWTPLGEFGPTVRSYRDAGLPPGDYEYRVTTFRPDGIGAAPCTDDDKSLSATSAPSTTTVGSQPSPRPTSSPSPGGTSGGDTSSGDGDGGDGGTEGDGDGGGGGDGAATGTGGDGGTTSGGSTRRVAPPPPPSRSGPELSAPDLPRPRVAEPEERFFGEGEGFDELLDYGDAGEDPDSHSTEELGEVEVEVEASGLTSVITRIFDSDRIVRFMAASLVLFTLALHVIRWMHDGEVT